MILSIQFPFADSRNFLHNTGRLTKPGWPFPTPDTEFVRYFGVIRKQNLDGLKGWGIEGKICTADRAFHFTQNLSYTNKTGQKTSLRCNQKKLYFDGNAVGTVEIGITLKSREKNKKYTI